MALTTLLPAATRRSMPWKNGGGTTVEIAVAPDGATLAHFDWRISMARILVAGPFSEFPGVDRTLCVLEGDGLVLHGLGSDPARLSVGSPPLAFPADQPVACTLVGGALTDLNVMSRRDRFAHTVARLHGPSVRFERGDDVCFVLADAPVTLVIDGQRFSLQARDAIRIDGGADIEIREAGLHAPFLIIFSRTATI